MQVEALVQADAPAKPGVGFPVSGRAAEPMRTSPKRAPCRPRLVGLSATGRIPANLQTHHTE